MAYSPLRNLARAGLSDRRFPKATDQRSGLPSLLCATKPKEGMKDHELEALVLLRLGST